MRAVIVAAETSAPADMSAVLDGALKIDIQGIRLRGSAIRAPTVIERYLRSAFVAEPRFGGQAVVNSRVGRSYG